MLFICDRFVLVYFTPKRILFLQNSLLNVTLVCTFKSSKVLVEKILKLWFGWGGRGKVSFTSHILQVI